MTAQFRNATGNDEIEVFTYSVFYVFYEQYLTIVNDAVLNLSICILAVTIITMLMLGKSSSFWPVVQYIFIVLWKFVSCWIWL